jgi:uncharacterized protein YpiB (UPF0302 family)
LDVLSHANPVALQAKSQREISVKVSASYNQDVEADYTIETIMEPFDNKELLKQIHNSMIEILGNYVIY